MDLNNEIKITLADKVAPSSAVTFKEKGYNVVEKPKIKYVERAVKENHVLGIRSKTFITKEMLEQPDNNLLAIGCYCIGTDQVDLEAAARAGIPVFNSPFGNTRSVAELIISQVIQLSRRVGDRNRECHVGTWGKTHIGCHEIRGKTLGVIGYGHVGSQVSILAESCGMKVVYYDTSAKLHLGNALRLKTMEQVLRAADFVTLHVPFTDITKNMIGKKEIAMMKRGSYLLNAARGKCVVLEDVREAILSGHLAGAYFDVYPKEPLNLLNNVLCGLPNVILTPHIGGSTEEAQENIAADVTQKLLEFLEEGTTSGSVNFPECGLVRKSGTRRIVNVHRNVPGVLKSVNIILSDYNVEGQMLSTRGDIGYLIVDFSSGQGSEKMRQIKTKMDELDASIRTLIMPVRKYWDSKTLKTNDQHVKLSSKL